MLKRYSIPMNFQLSVGPSKETGNHFNLVSRQNGGTSLQEKLLSVIAPKSILVFSDARVLLPLAPVTGICFKF